ncbi:hypothetical protein QYE76_020416 [Lolium multiflorum]|uniref:AP2/ERF domain-containing protein n=1 Tax=Lolium multiflorum TaxID=4521 RepID=A0AAD8VQ03_LOLMU|nr:hypothetical protein QYE76_020416 [Lolium multiflorum]
MAAAHDDAVASVCGKKTTGGTGFRGVGRTEHGTYCARIWDPWRRAMAYLGSFRTAEEAARAYGAAAAARRYLKLQGAAGGITDFRQRTAATSDDGDAPLPRVSCVDKSATAGSFSGQDAGSAKKSKKKRAAPRPEARTEFRGVQRRLGGKYCARIWDPWRRTMAYIGSFRTAEEAARAYGAAADARRHLQLQGAAGGITDFRQRTAATSDDGDAPPPRVSCVDKGATAGSFSGQDARSAKKNKKKRAAPRPEAWTEFRGVQRRLSGKYGAQIRHSKAHTWLGSFDTAEDAARAYDAATVRLHGAAAKTNFKADGGVGVQAVGLEKAARSGFRGVRQHRSGRYSARIWDSVKQARLWLGTFDKAEDAARAFDAAAVRLHGERAVTNFKQPLVDLNDFPELPALDFSDSIIPGAQLHDLWTDLPQAELQPLDELLQDMNFTDVAA